MWLTVEEPQLRAVVDEAIETVQRVARAEFWAEAKAGEHSEEAPFATAEANALINGVIDLLFDSSTGWQVRDYKTDLSVDQERYASQLKAYRQALERVDCVLGAVALVNTR